MTVNMVSDEAREKEKEREGNLQRPAQVLDKSDLK